MILFLTDSARHLRRPLQLEGYPVGRHEISAFADRERRYRLREDVKGRTVTLVASVLSDPRTLFDLLALHRLILENGASRINIVIPYLGYARQDRPNRAGEGSIGVMVSLLLRKLERSTCFVFDVHSDRIRKALGRSVRELPALSLFARVLSQSPPDVVVSPDTGAIPRAEALARLFEPRPGVACIEKIRPRANIAVAKCLRGDVAGKRVLVVDDMIDTGGTLAEAVKLLTQQGARSIDLAATHGLFSRNARRRLLRLPVGRILITNTLPQVKSPKVRILNVIPLLRHRLDMP